MNCIIVEDDLVAATALQIEIEKHEELQLLGIFQRPAEALTFLEQNSVDLIFLDVELPGMNGLEFIDQANDVAQIILVTGHPEFALEAFENDVTDFIVKPFTSERFDKAMNKVEKITQSIANIKLGTEKLFIKTGTKIKPLKIEEIKYIEALADYVKIQYTNDRFTVLSTVCGCLF